MFQVYVTHPEFTFTANPRPEVTRDTLESAIDYALQRTLNIVPCCSIWIQSKCGQSIAIMN
jgi:hypothetical protein